MLREPLALPGLFDKLCAMLTLTNFLIILSQKAYLCINKLKE